MTTEARVVAEFASPTFVVECDVSKLDNHWDETDLLYAIAPHEVVVRAESAEDALRYVQDLLAGGQP
jgi:hypothetical protein